jgi:hypothetical protein
LPQVELGQLQVAGLGNLQINLRAVDHGNGVSGALDDRGLVGADKPVCLRFGKGLFEQAEAEALRGLRQDDELAGDGCGDQSAVGGTLDVLDGVDSRQTDDGGAVLDDGVDGAVDGGGVDQRADRVVDQNDVVFTRSDRPYSATCASTRSISVARTAT